MDARPSSAQETSANKHNDLFSFSFSLTLTLFYHPIGLFQNPFVVLEAYISKRTKGKMPTFTGGGNRPSRKMRRGTNRGGSNSCSLSVVIVYGMLLMMFLYVTTMVVLTRYAGFTWTTTPSKSNDGDYKAHVYTRDEWGDRQKPAFDKKKDWGNGVKPELLRGASAAGEKQPKYDPPPDGHQQLPPKAPQATNRVLTAYLEPIDQSAWDQKPLPTRTWTSEDLTEIKFPKLQSCSRLTEQFPVDEFPEEDPFLPWIHDVFPTHDGKFIQFIAQNKRRCKSGSNAEEKEILKHMQPQVALFQHVAVKRIKNATESEPPRYRLARHEDADEDGMVTRFICRFHPSGQETLSVYNFNYEWASYRKKAKKMFHEDSGDNKSIHTSQLIFQCPVPDDLVDIVKSGESVLDDQATLFVDVIPIRTPPRYGSPNGFLPPYYQTKQFQAGDDTFDPKKEWGSNHILPAVQDSGRWENIPICKPTLQTYYHGNEHTLAKDDKALEQEDQQDKPPKKHRLVSCLWASSGYATRGNRFAINDGQRRLLEWITYNKLIGVEHFYLYENSGAFSDSDDYEGLQPIANLFPDDVTVIKWPSKVCNNNPNNVDSVGERSSQYAAEASCRLRFGPHTDWIAQFDIDEYLVPMGNHTSIHTVLDKLDQEGNKILSFGSWRAWPRRRFIEYVVALVGKCFLVDASSCALNVFSFRLPFFHFSTSGNLSSSMDPKIAEETRIVFNYEFQ